ncbi:hypothetical protein GBAR_LOCUS19050 [Geodia barretti]|nr:hypothetical protein GBAR_LOCUS19050 [Geodia barretti]
MGQNQSVLHREVSLIQRLKILYLVWGRTRVSSIERCPLFRGSMGQNKSVLHREVSLIQR